MEDVKRQLQQFKQEKYELEKELRGKLPVLSMCELKFNFRLENVNAEQKARHLEIRVAENAETLEHLRQERSILAGDHTDLQQRFSEISEVRIIIFLSLH